jgi:hypothetical protein
MPAHLDPDSTGAEVLSVRLSTSSATPWLARQLVGPWCREWQLPESVLDDAVLVVSELVSELVAAGAGSVVVGASPADTALQVSVSGPAGDGTGQQPDLQDDGRVRRGGIVEGVAAWVDERVDRSERTVVVAIPLSRAP